MRDVCDLVSVVCGAHAGDRHARRVCQVSEPVGPWPGELPPVSQQSAHRRIQVVTLSAQGGKGRQERIVSVKPDDLRGCSQSLGNELPRLGTQSRRLHRSTWLLDLRRAGRVSEQQDVREHLEVIIH